MSTGARESQPLVSVIVPAFNAEQHIGAALESVYAQDWGPFEVIVVDDGSTDRTAEVVQSFPDVRYVRQDNAGPAVARNAAIERSKGELIANLDSDDLLPPTRLTAQATYLLEHPEVGCVLGRQEWLNAPSWMARDAVYGDLDGIPLSSAMFRREVIVALGGYDSRYEPSEDMDVLIRMRERGIPYVVLPAVVLCRRFHESSLTAGRTQHGPILQALRAKMERSRAEQQEHSS